RQAPSLRRRSGNAAGASRYRVVPSYDSRRERVVSFCATVYAHVAVAIRYGPGSAPGPSPGLAIVGAHEVRPERFPDAIAGRHRHEHVPVAARFADDEDPSTLVAVTANVSSALRRPSLLDQRENLLARAAVGKH